MLFRLAHLHLRSPRLLNECRNELAEETGFKSILLDEARSQLDKASDMLMCVIDEEEQRLRQKMSDVDRKQHPLIQALWRYVVDRIACYSICYSIWSERYFTTIHQ